jgi:hypothetical protein
MEEKKNIFIDKGLSLRSEEVNEVMGNVPHRVFRIGTFIFICIVALLVAIGYTLQVPNYIEVPYIVSGNTSAIGIVSKNAGIVMFRYNQPHNINEGDTIATVMNGNDSVYSISPVRGIVENNFLYTTGDNIVRGDTLARVISCELPNYRLILKISRNIKSEILCGMKIKIITKETMTENAVGYIKKISVIPDEANCYNAVVEMPINIIQNLPRFGKARVLYKQENVFTKIFANRNKSAFE